MHDYNAHILLAIQQYAFSQKSNWIDWVLNARVDKYYAINGNWLMWNFIIETNIKTKKNVINLCKKIEKSCASNIYEVIFDKPISKMKDIHQNSLVLLIFRTRVFVTQKLNCKTMRWNQNIIFHYSLTLLFSFSEYKKAWRWEAKDMRNKWYFFDNWNCKYLS